MTVLAEQHSTWKQANQRLWAPARQPPRPRQPRPAAVPHIVILPQLMAFGWPLYPQPVFYDHCEPNEPMMPPPKGWRQIAREVCAKHRVSMDDLVSARRDKATVLARHEAEYRCRHETPMSLPQIGRRFGQRDHTSVLYGVRKHAERLAGIEPEIGEFTC